MVQQAVQGNMSTAAQQLAGKGEAAQQVIRGERRQREPPQRHRLQAAHVLLILFSGNFLGILCARTLHFQFYSWWVLLSLHSLYRIFPGVLPTEQPAACQGSKDLVHTNAYMFPRHSTCLSPQMLLLIVLLTIMHAVQPRSQLRLAKGTCICQMQAPLAAAFLLSWPQSKLPQVQASIGSMGTLVTKSRYLAMTSHRPEARASSSTRVSRYFHTLPFMLWQLPLPDAVRLGMWLMIEAIWNVFPSNALTSLALLLLHSFIGIQLWRLPPAAWC